MAHSQRPSTTKPPAVGTALPVGASGAGANGAAVPAKTSSRPAGGSFESSQACSIRNDAVHAVAGQPRPRVLVTSVSASMPSPWAAGDVGTTSW